MKTVFIDLNPNGHHLEYVTHLFSKASKDTDNKYIFILHPLLIERGKFDSTEHIKFIPKENNKTNLNEIKEILIEQRPLNVFFISIAEYLKLILKLVTATNIIIHGIEYVIPYRRTKSSVITKFKDALKFSFYRLHPSIRVLYLLNDIKAPNHYNKIYGTKKFCYLPDPYVPIDLDEDTSKSGEEQNKIIHFVHCGALSDRKGTFTILEAIKQLTQETKAKVKFTISGLFPCTEERESFVAKLNEIQDADITYIDRFLSYQELGKLFKSSDYILIPYKSVSQSSGMLGYSAQFRKPLISPDEGLIGEMVNNYNLGITIKNLSSSTLADRISEIANCLRMYKVDGTDYLKISGVDNFNETIFGNLTHKL